MATSRTGTTRWKNLRTRALNGARAHGQATCPLCNRPLAWGTTRQPLSPEPDHIIPHARGGADSMDNLRIICRDCNIKRGNGGRRKTMNRVIIAPPTSGNW